MKIVSDYYKLQENVDKKTRINDKKKIYLITDIIDLLVYSSRTGGEGKIPVDLFIYLVKFGFAKFYILVFTS